MFRIVSHRVERHFCESTIESLEGRRLFDGAAMPVSRPTPPPRTELPPPQYDHPIGPPAPSSESTPEQRDAHYAWWAARYQEEFGLCPFTDPLPFGPPTPIDLIPGYGEFNADGGGGPSGIAKEGAYVKG
jgi:hypothetical protein